MTGTITMDDRVERECVVWADRSSLWADGGTGYVLASSHLHGSELQLIRAVVKRPGRADEAQAVLKTVQSRRKENDQARHS